MSYSLESYKPQTPSQERALVVAKKVVDIARSYSQESDTKPAIVVFSGNPGVGKTHLLEGIRLGLKTNAAEALHFSGSVTKAGKGDSNKIITGDDVFSGLDSLDKYGGSFGEMKALNELILDEWYPAGRLAILTSNFSLTEIQAGLTAQDSIGRASSRLDEMARRGADIAIAGPDHRGSVAIESMF